MASQHALLSPSSADRWMLCPGAVAMEQGLPDTGDSLYRDEGTAAHFLASECLSTDTHPATHLGKSIFVGAVPDGFDGAVWGITDHAGFVIREEFTIDGDMAGFVNAYVQAVKHHAEGGTLLVEQSLPIGHLTGEVGATGTGDAVVIVGTELQVHDLKYGRGQRVSAENNRQLMIYALGALHNVQDFAEITSVRLFIHQPRVHHTASEWLVPDGVLDAFAISVGERAFHALQVLNSEKPEAYAHHLRPSDDACLWCKAKADCPALAKLVSDTVGAQFDTLDDIAPIAVAADSADDLATKLSACDLIEDWVKAVRAAAYARLNAGEDVPGFKLVRGKRGNRQWQDEKEAEALLKSMRLKVDEMYDLKLISPTSAEKIFGEKGSTPSPKRWSKLAASIVQKEGGLSVAPATDPRPAVKPTPAADSFTDETGGDLA